MLVIDRGSKAGEEENHRLVREGVHEVFELVHPSKAEKTGKFVKPIFTEANFSLLAWLEIGEITCLVQYRYPLRVTYVYQNPLFSIHTTVVVFSLP